MAAMNAGDSAPAGCEDSVQAQVLRAALVQKVQENEPWPPGSSWDPRVLRAIGEVPRHCFVPGVPLIEAYADEPYPIGHDQTISQPTVVALMTQALLLEGNERVLEIGTGCGYQTAVLARLARAVFSIERIAWLGQAAQARLAAMGVDNFAIRIGDGHAGWPSKAPFDRVLVTAAPIGVPQSLVDQLADGGILVAPVGDLERQVLMRWVKRAGRMEEEELGLVRFVPMLPGTF
jgi:protein-L-isoaspartate(D-aspartate) O-methyltransferase